MIWFSGSLLWVKKNWHHAGTTCEHKTAPFSFTTTCFCATFTSMRWQYDICIMALHKPCNIFLHGLACATRCPMESVWTRFHKILIHAESYNLKLSRLSFDSLKSSLSNHHLVLNPYHFGDEETCKKVEKKERNCFNKMSFISGNNKEKLQIESQTYLTGTASPLTWKLSC